ncbi:MAG: hypothetical protein ACUVYA_03780 [Planctomycetota bacterium]
MRDLRCPPLFRLQGPDGSSIGVILERDLEELPVVGGKVTVALGARGFAALRLLR